MSTPGMVMERQDNIIYLFIYAIYELKRAQPNAIYLKIQWKYISAQTHANTHIFHLRIYITEQFFF